MNSLNKSASMPERRKHSRYSIPLEVYINKNIEEKTNKPVDISEEGVCIQSHQNFDEKDFVLFNFIGKNKTVFENIHLDVLGRIVWSSKDERTPYKYGVQFQFYNDPYFKQQYSILQTLFDQVYNNAHREKNLRKEHMNKKNPS